MKYECVFEVENPSFLTACFNENLGRLHVYWKNVLQWILKIIDLATFVFNFCFLFLLYLKLPSCNLHFLVCFCYWPNSFIKGDEGGIFTKFPHRKPLLLFKIKIKQNSSCPSKEYNVVFKRFYQNIRVYHRGKKICIDQWMVKYYLLTKQVLSEQVWFVQNKGGGSAFICCWVTLF